MATPEAQRIVDQVKARYGDKVRIDAGTVVRPINNQPGKPYSQHSWGNALDIHPGPGQDKSILDDVASWLRSRPRNEVAQVLWQNDEHHQNHIHVSAAPLRSGVPPGVPADTVRVGFTEVPVDKPTVTSAGVAFSDRENLLPEVAAAYDGGPAAPLGGLKAEHLGLGGPGLVERAIFTVLGLGLLIGGGALLSQSLGWRKLLPQRTAPDG